MKKFLVFIAMLLFNSGLSFAQVGINTDNSIPNNSAMLDVKSANKGMLIPRIALTGTTDATTIVTPATSLLVYNTATVSDVTPGYYYWNGTTAWVRLTTGGVAANPPITAGTNTKITYDAKGLVTAGASATTADIAASTDKNYVTNAQLTVIGNTSGINTGDQTNITGTASNVTGIVLGANGGTGKANSGKTITLGGNLTTSGAFNTTLTSTAATAVTLPAAGTLATLAGTEALTNKTIAAGSNTITGLTNSNLSGTAGITDANLATISTTGKVSNSATTATSANTASKIVARDASGNFSAGTITAALSGNATRATNITGGAGGSVPYQTAANTTAFLAKGTADQVLAMNTAATAPEWKTLPVSNWSLTGNSGTNPATNFIGTIDEQSLFFKANNSISGWIDVTYSENCGFGYGTLGHNTIGGANSAFGTFALMENTTGAGNSAFGRRSLEINTTGNANSAFGIETLPQNNGSGNSAFGESSLLTNGTGSLNSAFGFGSLINNNSGEKNSAVGSYALDWNTTGFYNTAIGYSANVSSSDQTNSTAIGANAVATLSNQVRLGDNNVTSLYCKGAYTPITTSPANVYVDATGQIGRTTNHYIGESYGGGIVFYVYDGGLHGLIGSLADQIPGGVRWWAGTYTHSMAKADGVGAGKANTAIIIANEGYGDGATYAARVCNEYSVTVDGVTYGDWYLPSSSELYLLYLEQAWFYNFSSDFYWSSTEYSDIYTLICNFANGTQAYNVKAMPYYIRAIRAF